jgi:TolA-binding protein
LESRPPQAQLEASISNEQQRQFVTEIKQAASYWLGIIAYEQGDYRVAVDYFRERVLIASPDGPWTGGARYNLGRSYEAMGEIEQAVAQYQLDTSPQSTGNKVRARRLLEKMSAS